MTLRGPEHELDHLLMKLVEGDLSPEEQQHLCVLLRGRPDLQEKYRHYLLLDSLLRWELTASAAAPTKPASNRPRRLLTMLGRLAACLALLAAGYLLHAWQQAAFPPPDLVAVAHDQPEPEAHGLAVLTQSVQARWADDSTAPGVGSTVGPGPFRLLEGLVQLEFHCGATLVVEGPADLELLAVDRLLCRSGKLRASVPSLSGKFTILSSAATLSEVGAEFGLDVSANGATEVHVFAGKVDLRAPSADPPQNLPREVAAGRGLKLDRDDKPTSVAADEKHFPSATELERRAELAAAERRKRWLLACEQLARDCPVVVHYPFDGQGPTDRFLSPRNPANGTPAGAVIGCQWAGGRWPGKKALEFKTSGDRVRVTVPGQFDSLTMMTWVRVDSLDHRYNALFLTDGFDVGTPHWQITEAGRLQLGVCHGIDGTRWLGTNYDSDVVFTPDQFGQWKHLAVVYDGPGGLVSHYVNGQLVAARPLSQVLTLTPGSGQLGNWTPRTGNASRSLNGRMDEFVAVGEALPAAEIEALYKSGEPIH